MFWWLPLATSAAGAVAGGLLGSREQRAADDARREAAKLNMWAPLFGKAPEALGPRHDLTTQGILSGLIRGAEFGQQFGGALEGAGAPALSGNQAGGYNLGLSPMRSISEEALAGYSPDLFQPIASGASSSLPIVSSSPNPYGLGISIPKPIFGENLYKLTH